jgi:hypothetical protein
MASLLDQSRARRGLTQLHADLSAIIQRDQEQEVRGIAVPTVSEAIRAAYDVLTEDRVAAVTVELFSADVIAEGEPVRAVDALLVVGQLLAALGPEPSYAPPVVGKSIPMLGGRRRAWNMDF